MTKPAPLRCADPSRRRLLAAAGGLALLPGLAWADTAGRARTNFANALSAYIDDMAFDEAWELAWGGRAYPALIQAFGGAYPNSGAQAALNAFLQPLAAASARPFAWEARLVNSDEVTALALPGGKLAVTRGLLMYLSTPWDLAGVLAHEMGHAEAGHMADQLQAGLFQTSDLVTRESRRVAALVAADPRAVADPLAEVVAGALTEAARRGYSPEQERQADGFAVTAFARAGLDPVAASHVWHRLLRLNPAGAQRNSLLMPAEEVLERLKLMDQMAATLPRPDAPGPGDAWAEAFRMLKTTVPNRRV